MPRRPNHSSTSARADSSPDCTPRRYAEAAGVVKLARHGRLKIGCLQRHEGSSPSPGTSRDRHGLRAMGLTWPVRLLACGPFRGPPAPFQQLLEPGGRCGEGSRAAQAAKRTTVASRRHSHSHSQPRPGSAAVKRFGMRPKPVPPIDLKVCEVPVALICSIEQLLDILVREQIDGPPSGLRSTGDGGHGRSPRSSTHVASIRCERPAFGATSAGDEPSRGTAAVGAVVKIPVASPRALKP